jgi:hypothetical protein
MGEIILLGIIWFHLHQAYHIYLGFKLQKEWLEKRLAVNRNRFNKWSTMWEFISPCPLNPSYNKV